jgi:hypothetical protein
MSETERAEVDRIRDGHPLAAVLPLLRDTLVSIADEAMHMMIVTDAKGNILWREGQRDVLRRAEQIHSAERPARPGHHWSCAASPVHDPDTGEVIGAVGVTGPLHAVHPTTLALVVAAAQLAESHLAAQLALRDGRLLARNLPLLADLGGEPGALLAPTGRVLAAQPHGWLPARVALPATGDRVQLGEAGDGVLEPVGEGWLLRLRRTVHAHP